MFERLVAAVVAAMADPRAREDRLPIDRAVSLRRERMEVVVSLLVFLAVVVLFAVLGRTIRIAIVGIAGGIVVIVMGVAIDRGRGPSGLPPREAPMTDELPAERRAKAAREDRE
jgi:hypothetical protein